MESERVKFSLNTTEMLDWQENWCFRCVHDHDWSHTGKEEGEPCELTVPMVLGHDVPQFEARDPEWWRMIPAPVSCSRFELCDRCPDESPDAERRSGETRREFHDRLRAETLAQPVVPA